MLPIEVRNRLGEEGNLENRRPDNYEGQLEQVKAFSSDEKQENKEEDEEKKFLVPPEVSSFIHQVIEGRAFPVPRFSMPMRPVESLEVPMEASAHVMGDHEEQQDKTQGQEEQHVPQEAQQHMMPQHEEQAETNRPHCKF